MTEYLVPYESAESEFEEKRSRFISHVFLVETEAERSEEHPSDLRSRLNSTYAVSFLKKKKKDYYP